MPKKLSATQTKNAKKSKNLKPVKSKSMPVDMTSADKAEAKALGDLGKTLEKISTAKAKVESAKSPKAKANAAAKLKLLNLSKKEAKQKLADARTNVKIEKAGAPLRAHLNNKESKRNALLEKLTAADDAAYIKALSKFDAGFKKQRAKINGKKLTSFDQVQRQKESTLKKIVAEKRKLILSPKLKHKKNQTL